MQIQLADLQQKLTGEEEEKSGLAIVNEELKKTSEDMTKVKSFHNSIFFDWA